MFPKNGAYASKSHRATSRGPRQLVVNRWSRASGGKHQALQKLGVDEGLLQNWSCHSLMIMLVSCHFSLWKSWSGIYFHQGKPKKWSHIHVDWWTREFTGVSCSQQLLLLLWPWGGTEHLTSSASWSSCRFSQLPCFYKTAYSLPIQRKQLHNIWEAVTFWGTLFGSKLRNKLK